MKIIFIILILFMLGCKEDIKAPSSKEVISTKPLLAVEKQFQAVWDEVNSDILTKLPQNEVSYGQLFRAGVNIIFEDAKRTLNNHKDMLKSFNKLAHPNGVCLRGLWSIDKKNPYSGYFKKGSEALVIARASSALNNTKKGEIRAFGLAIKLFPTTNPKKINQKDSANFFVIDDLGGTDAPYFTDVALTNEPDISTNFVVLKFALYALEVKNAFEDADENPNIRQVYEISYLGEDKFASIITPKWIKIEAKKGQTKTEATDFREEFFLKEGEKLIFNISVASTQTDKVKNWNKIGTITFDKAVVSNTCDHRLHFHHPKWKEDLVYE